MFRLNNIIEYNYFIIVRRIPKYRNSSQIKPGLALICGTAMRNNYLSETGLNDNCLLFIM